MKSSCSNAWSRPSSVNRMFAAGDRVAVAVSGGADSVCLLHVLLDLAPRWDLALSVLHVNHNFARRGIAGRCRVRWRAGGEVGAAFDVARSGSLRHAREPGAVRPQRPPGLLPRPPRQRTRHPCRARAHTLRPGRNRPLPFSARLWGYRACGDPPVTPRGIVRR